MNYYLTEITLLEGAEKETPGIYIYDEYNKALAVFHQKMGSMMKQETTKSELLVIMDAYGNTMRSERYIKPEPEPQPEPTPEPEPEPTPEPEEETPVEEE